MGEVPVDRNIPLVVSTGSPYERGLQLGRSASGRVAHTVAAYLIRFRAQAGLRRDAVLAQGERFIPAIERYAPELLDEMRGIADGAEYDLREIVAINARTELLYGLPARAECTALGADARASADGHVRVGQNWDWHPALAGGLVLWAIRRDEGHDVVTLTEAGMVGKIGANAAGLALCVNLLTGDADHAGPAAPMHVILRHVLDTARTVDEAIAVLAAAGRCTSCNQLLGDRDGNLADVESTPAGQAVFLPEAGILVHTNHCLEPEFAAADRYVRDNPETLARRQRARELAEAPLSEAGFLAVLADHATAPGSICCHVRHDRPAEERAESIASIVFDLTAGTLDLADGPPCSFPYRRMVLADLLRDTAHPARVPAR